MKLLRSDIEKPFTLHSMQRRIVAIMIAMLILATGLAVRLFYVQVISSKELQRKATDQWTRDLSLAGERGEIFDATGDPLAVSYTTYDVYVRAREVKNKELVARKLSEILDLKYESVLKKVEKTNISESLIKLQVESELAEEIYKLKLDGVFLSESIGRKYIYGDLLTQVLGFMSIDGDGQAGVEAYFDKYLAGIDGYSYVQSDLQGKEIGGNLRYYIAGQKGNSLHLTVNSKIQLLLEKELERCFDEQKALGVSGIVLDVKTGKVVAVSSKPSFDLNNIPRDDLESLFKFSRLNVVTDTYEPGSTFKILTLAMALESGVVKMSDRFYCPGFRVVDGQRIKCWKTTGHGSQTLIEAFGNSCNCCFMDLALRLGVDRFFEYVNLFGLGKKTGITVSGESSGILMNKKDVKKVDLARMGFGHAIALTPLQLITAISGVINGGVYHSPALVEKIVDKDGNTTFVPKVQERKLVSKATSDLVNQCLIYTTNKTGNYTFVEGYNVGGKTGTAQKYNESGAIAQGKYISSFVGTYPGDSPEYALLLVVNEPGAGAYYGSVVASPYGKAFYQNLLTYLDRPKDNDNVEKIEVVMPDVVGMNIVQAMVLFKSLNLYCEVYGEGSVITKQLPPAGKVCYQGETIIVCT